MKEKELELVLKTKDYMVSKKTFSIVRRKGQSYLETQPVPEALDSYYESEEYLSHTDSSSSFFEKLYQFIKSYTLKSKVSSLGKPFTGSNKLLDLGAGTGDFLQVAKKRGWQVSGVEPNLQARNLAEQKGLVLKSSLEDFKQEQFDVISLWHVLEHIPNLEETLIQLESLLKPGGVLVIALPNYKSWDAKKYKEFWAAYDVPRHLWHFDKTSMKNLFPKNIVKTKIKPMWFDAFYVSLLSERYKTNNTNWLKASVNGFYSNLLACFTKEWSSIVYYYQKNAK